MITTTRRGTTTVSAYIVAQRRRNLPLKGMFAQGKFALPFSAADAASTIIEIYVGMRLPFENEYTRAEMLRNITVEIIIALRIIPTVSV